MRKAKFCGSSAETPASGPHHLPQSAAASPRTATHPASPVQAELTAVVPVSSSAEHLLDKRVPGGWYLPSYSLSSRKFLGREITNSLPFLSKSLLCLSSHSFSVSFTGFFKRSAMVLSFSLPAFCLSSLDEPIRSRPSTTKAAFALTRSPHLLAWVPSSHP